MLNNKYLAVVLVVVAVGVITYQIVFGGKKKPKAQPVPVAVAESVRPDGADAAPGSAPMTGPASVAAAPVSGTAPASSSPVAPAPAPAAASAPDAAQQDGLIIDYDSPMLLKKVSDNPMEDYPRQELSTQFGAPVFTLPAIQSAAGKKKEEALEIRFHLNSVNIDSNRRLAVVNNTIVKVGDVISGARVTDIQKRSVVLEIKKRRVVLTVDKRIETIKLSGGQGDL